MFSSTFSFSLLTLFLTYLSFILTKGQTNYSALGCNNYYGWPFGWCETSYGSETSSIDECINGERVSTDYDSVDCSGNATSTNTYSNSIFGSWTCSYENDCNFFAIIEYEEGTNCGTIIDHDVYSYVTDVCINGIIYSCDESTWTEKEYANEDCTGKSTTTKNYPYLYTYLSDSDYTLYCSSVGTESSCNASGVSQRFGNNNNNNMLRGGIMVILVISSFALFG